MRMSRLAWMNFCNSVQNYLSLVLSLAFTVLVFLNFQNILASDAYAVLGSQNQAYVKLLVNVVLFVLGCFSFFYVWYATNVFLNRRKKEIGIYIFMGLTNRQIGKMYAIETGLIGVAALVLGIMSGELFAGLFQMVLVWLSDVAVNISFHFSLKPVIGTAIVYGLIYLLFVVRGYRNISGSSVSSMLSAARQNERLQQKNAVLFLKALLGVGVLGLGYFLSVEGADPQQIVANAFCAVVLVTAGTYLLFGGFLPLVFQGLAQNKRYLYRKERILWVNSMVFRICRNYRTYAMVSVLSLCAVTALACGFGMKERYDSMQRFDHAYTFQLITNQTDLGAAAEEILTRYTELSGQSEIPVLSLEGTPEGQEAPQEVMVAAYERVRQAAEAMGLPFLLEKPGDQEVISAVHVPLMSLMPGQTGSVVTIAGEEYQVVAETEEPYLGYLQKNWEVYLVNEAVYEQLRDQGWELNTYNYVIAENSAFEEAREALDSLVINTEEIYTGRVAVDPEDPRLAWVRVLYSLCIFMALVFIVAGGCIMFMKQYNDGFEERERYLVLQKLGIRGSVLRRAVQKELGSAYLLAFVVMAVSSLFAVNSLGTIMRTDLTGVNLVSVLVIMVIFLLFYLISVSAYLKNVRVRGD